MNTIDIIVVTAFGIVAVLCTSLLALILIAISTEGENERDNNRSL